MRLAPLVSEAHLTCHNESALGHLLGIVLVQSYTLLDLTKHA